MIWILAFIDVAVLFVRFRLVAYVTGSYLGQSCTFPHHYDPAERIYLIVVTVLSLVLCVTVIASLVLLDVPRSQYVPLAVLLFVMVVILGYAALVWGGGLELSNKLVPEVDPCGGIRGA